MIAHVATSRRSAVAPILAAFVLAVPAASAQQSPARTDVFALIQEAERRLAEEQLDAALPWLWRAQSQLGELEGETLRETTRRTIEAMLDGADPLHAERVAALQAAAEQLCKLARSYRVAKWWDTANDLLDEADALVPGSSALERALVEKQRLRQQGREPVAAPPAELPAESPVQASPDADLLPSLSVAHMAGPWQRTAEVTTSPVLEAGSPLLLAREPLHEDHVLRIQIRTGAIPAAAAFVFGVRGVEEYYIAELWHGPDAAWTSLRLMHVTGASQVEALTERTCRLDPDELAGWIDMTVEVQGRRVVVALSDKGRIEATCPTVPHGSVGLFVSSQSPNKQPIGFRKLRIEPLPGDGAAAAVVVDEAAAAAAALQDRVQAAEARVGDDPEAAVRELRSVARALPGMRSAAARSALTAAIGELIDTHDRQAAKTRIARRKIASIYTALARRYLDGGRPVAASELLRTAGAHDARAPAELRPAVEAALEAIPDKRRARR